MQESASASGTGTWNAGPCPFVIEYSLRVIDEIRLAVVDAFFSVPRGGAEIGGMLLGRNQGRTVSILDYLPLECEHATGPSFVLSPRDHSRLAEMLASARGRPGGIVPVGWYHSHTRSEIHLSPEDLEIHRRYFPERWQIALVLKPHASQATTMGFFYQEADGSILSSTTYLEVAIQPLAARRVTEPAAPAAAPLTLAPPAPMPRKVEPVRTPEAELKPEPAPRGEVQRKPPAPAPTPVPPVLPQEIPVAPAPIAPVIPIAASPMPVSARKTPAPEALEGPALDAEIPPPAFAVRPAPRSRGGWGIAVGLLIGLLAGGAAYATRHLWMPDTAGAPASKAPYIGLSTMDVNGQLQIRWDRDSPAVRASDEGSLVIEGGPSPEAIQLDPAHLRSGSFTYGRQSERVDVSLTLRGRTGEIVKETSTYLGKLPARMEPQDPTAGKPDDDELERLRVRNQRLEKTVNELRQELRRSQKRQR